ncbi:V-type proton ATPase subunit E [Nilaparvata lugens]|uniref:V-type proton ATPase subunit E n=1 Tax=Nilaparvata lugens TaxID=108931 RepID=UPI000B97D2A4|nr:V-type proton ATPase subunit E [Nilaparvata lugens]
MASKKDQSIHDIKSMVEYIEQDGWEKVEEIEVKSQEEFEIEKTKIRDTEIIKLEHFYNRQEEKLTRTLKAESSRSKLRSKIGYLEAQKNIILEIINKARHTIEDCSNKESQRHRYKKIMEELLLRSALTMMESDIKVKVRKKDHSLLHSIIESTSNEFKRITGNKISMKIDDTHLPDSSAGGIILSNLHERVFIDNTLATRLEIVIGNMNSPFMPMFKHLLFDEEEEKKR